MVQCFRPARRIRFFMDDEIFIQDYDIPEEWLAQVFEVVALETRSEQSQHDEHRERSRHPAGAHRQHRGA